jgi:beta-lactam-binding protein with PASTA domain/tetratricopeptide (TPR) repeat protein
MNPHKTLPSTRTLLLPTLALFALLNGTLTQPSSAGVQGPTPAALVKSIVIDTQEVLEANTSQAVITRSNGETVPATAGLALFIGDRVETFDSTNLTLLFLDAPVSERDNEVIVAPNARVGISSTDSWWGKIWVKVKDTFVSKTSYVRLGAKGTEYELEVLKGQNRATLVVLEGVVTFEKGTFTLAEGSSPLDNLTSELRRVAQSPAPDFAHYSRQVQEGRVLKVDAGKITTFGFVYRILNSCGQTHQFEFRIYEGTSWVKLSKPIKVGVLPGEGLPVDVAVQVDATQLRPDVYRTHVYAICADCYLEPRCAQAQLDWPLTVTVTPGKSVPLPPSNGVVTTGRDEVRELQEVLLTPGIDRPVQTTDGRVLSVLDWTNNVILTAQPTYSAQNLIPNFSDKDQRSRSFKSARQRSILSKREPGSNKTLGDVYSDWGQAAQAVFAYEKEVGFEVEKSEAYRLTGRLDKAEDLLRKARDQQSDRALNAYGNLSLDYAKISIDQGSYSQARNRIEQAESYYGSVPKIGRQGGAASIATIQTNLGEAHVVDGNLAQLENNLSKAKTQYSESLRSLEGLQQGSFETPFAVTNLGRAYKGLGDVAALERNPAEASRFYRIAQTQHEKAIAAHPDFAEAYFNLGDLFVALGDNTRAKESYWQAIKNRPEQPAPYYPLAVLIQRENPQLAATLAATYLQLEPAIFKQGQKARNAERIKQGENIVPPAGPPVGPTTGPPVGQPVGPPAPPDTPPPTEVLVPNLLNKSRAAAISAIEDAGFTPGRIETRSDPKAADRVIEQRPSAGARANRGSAIDFVVTVGKQVEVPEVIDDKEQTAIRKITDKGLKVGTIERRKSCKSVGKVLEQNPRKSAKVDPGTEVNLVLGSLGENPVTVPDLTRGDRRQAEATIQNLGLTLKRVKTQETDDAREGTVIGQSPQRDSQFAQGCEVNVEITVAIPIPWANVGDYVNKTLVETNRQLRDINLYGVVTEYRESTDYAPGLVLSQNPAPGSRVRQKSPVYLVVSGQKRAENVTVRNVVGMKFEEAKKVLERLGLTVVEPTYEDINPCERRGITNGIVRKQDPQEGRSVPAGTPIKLTVSRVLDVICE